MNACWIWTAALIGLPPVAPGLRPEPAQEPDAMPEVHEHTNRLIDETSPYLLQHAHNPVDWYPWGPEALQRAKDEQKPIFLSIGYSACHWCHVMERESFENEEIAALMNKWFVSIKVDREERPDIDEIYMKAVQAMTGSGGWPMSVFMTPDLEPFFGGTYFPPEPRYGRRSFPQLLESVANAWRDDRESLLKDAARLTEYIRQDIEAEAVSAIDPSVLPLSLSQLQQSFDPVWGGFGAAPKFPHAQDVRILLRHWRRTGEGEVLGIATTTLDRMAEGGVYDQLGGGFHRYSTDEKWLIPHFEKMLYDNALLVPAYLEAYLATGEERYARVARECCQWVLREMVTPEGGFASSQDADSEGVEGKFFAWTPDELTQVLGSEHGLWAAHWYGVTEEGNFEHGASALWRHDPPQQVADRLRVPVGELEAAMRTARVKLFEARERRVHPGTDDKVLASWNGLMISALAQAYQVLGERSFLDAARRSARYVLEHMRQEDGRLLATARAGRAHLNAYLDDYAFMIQGLIDLYESDFDAAWLRQALELDAILSERFEDEDMGGYFTTSNDHEKLIARLKVPHDGALPSGSGVQAHNLLRLAELTGRSDLAKQAERTILSAAGLVTRYPQGFSQLLMAVDYLASQPREIVIAGDPASPAVAAMLAVVRGRFMPWRVVALAHAGADSELMPLLAERSAPAGGARGYVCRSYACKQPVDTPEELSAQLDER